MTTFQRIINFQVAERYPSLLLLLENCYLSVGSGKTQPFLTMESADSSHCEKVKFLMRLAGVETSDCSLNFRLPLGDYRTRSKEREFPSPSIILTILRCTLLDRSDRFPPRSRFASANLVPSLNNGPVVFREKSLLAQFLKQQSRLDNNRGKKNRARSLVQDLSGVSKDYLYRVGLKFKRFIIRKND